MKDQVAISDVIFRDFERFDIINPDNLKVFPNLLQDRSTIVFNGNGGAVEITLFSIGRKNKVFYLMKEVEMEQIVEHGAAGN